MPVLRETEFTGEVVWLGHVPAGGSIRADGVDKLELGFAGERGARHEGVNRPSCVRVDNLYPRGTEIRNVRQLDDIVRRRTGGDRQGHGCRPIGPNLSWRECRIAGHPGLYAHPSVFSVAGPNRCHHHGRHGKPALCAAWSRKSKQICPVMARVSSRQHRGDAA